MYKPLLSGQSLRGFCSCVTTSSHTVANESVRPISSPKRKLKSVFTSQAFNYIVCRIYHFEIKSTHNNKKLYKKQKRTGIMKIYLATANVFFLQFSTVESSHMVVIKSIRPVLSLIRKLKSVHFTHAFSSQAFNYIVCRRYPFKWS